MGDVQWNLAHVTVRITTLERENDRRIQVSGVEASSCSECLPLYK